LNFDRERKYLRFYKKRETVFDLSPVFKFAKNGKEEAFREKLPV